MFGATGLVEEKHDEAVNPLAFPYPHGPSLTVEMPPGRAPGYGTHAAAGSGLCAERGLSRPGVSLPGGRPSRLTLLRQSVQLLSGLEG